jgi:GntR family transcriptional regulator
MCCAVGNAAFRHPKTRGGQVTSTSSARPGRSHQRADAARRFADLVRFDIHSGRFGEQLPYEWDLLRRYGASRAVLREALAGLSDQGVLRRMPGIGTLRRVDSTAISLTQVAAPLQVVDAGSGSAEEIDESRMLVETIAHERSKAPLPVAEALAIAPGDPVLFTESLLHVDGSPHRLRSSWIPLDRVPGVEVAVAGRYPVRVLRDLLGAPLLTRHFLLKAVGADESVATHLGIPAGAALLLSERVIHTKDGLPVEFGFTRHRGDRSHVLANSAC